MKFTKDSKIVIWTFVAGKIEELLNVHMFALLFYVYDRYTLGPGSPNS